MKLKLILAAAALSVTFASAEAMPTAPVSATVSTPAVQQAAVVVVRRRPYVRRAVVVRRPIVRRPIIRRRPVVIVR